MITDEQIANWLQYQGDLYLLDAVGGTNLRALLEEVQAARSKPVAGVEVKPDFYGVWSGKIHIGTWADEKTAREVASEYDSPAVVPLYTSLQPEVVITEDGRCDAELDVALNFVQPKLQDLKTEKGLIGVWAHAWRMAWKAAQQRDLTS